MKLTLNNSIEEIPDSITTVSELLTYKKFTFPRIIVKINGRLIRKPDYSATALSDLDHLEVIHMVSGG